MDVLLTLLKLKMDKNEYKTITYHNEGDYFVLMLETNDGFCFAIDIMDEDVVK